MRHGKFEKTRPRRRKLAKKFLVLLGLVLILGMTVGGTVAYLVRTSTAVTNSFTAAQVSCSVDGLAVKNTSNIPAYIRATYTVNWMDQAGNVSGTKPTYTPAINSVDWQHVDGIYYYNSKVGVGETTNALITNFSSETSGEYKLVVEVVAEAIQADGMGATSAVDAWAKAKTTN